MNERTKNYLRLAFDEWRIERARALDQAPPPPSAADLDSFFSFVREVVVEWRKKVAELGERPCCIHFNVNHVIYKGQYLPSADEYEAHGYKRSEYDKALVSWKQSIDTHGHL